MERPSNLESLYPDVAALAGLPNALQHALDAIGSSLRVAKQEVPKGFPSYARLESSERFSQIYIAAEERLFLPDFWCRGVIYANGKSSELDDVARAVDVWVGSDCTIGELASEFRFIAPEQKAEAFEQGREVEWAWMKYVGSLDEHRASLQPFVNAASVHPQLSQLFPFPSLNWFCFSRCTGYPYTRDIPYVFAHDAGRVEVFNPEGQSIGIGGVDEAIELVVANLTILRDDRCYLLFQ